MWANAFFLEVNLSLTQGRRAELGFLGVTILKRKTTPRLWGDFFNLGRLHL